MELKLITCPNCGAKIDVTEQIVKVAQLEANRLAKEQAAKVAKDAAERAREEERRRSEKAAQELNRKNEKLTRALERKDKELTKLAENRARELVRQEVTAVKNSYKEQSQQRDLRIAELERNYRKAQNHARDLEARLAQGSAQHRGVIAEANLYEYLRKQLPSDRCRVEKHGQGKKGTDILVHVHKQGKQLGTIIVDDKWAQAWDRQWPEKVWNDMKLHEAEFAYIAANPSAFPKESKDKDLREAGFGLAPCRRAGVRVWLIDRSNLPLVYAILMDSVDTIMKLAEVKAVYGTGSESLKQFKDYLAHGYEQDLREKAKHMSTAIKALDDMYRKVIQEYERARDALRNYWVTEERQHKALTKHFGEEIACVLPQITFAKET